jgi:hypothetical protein
MKIFILVMWLYASDTPLIIGGYSSLEKCESVRPQYDRPYSFGLCSSMEVEQDQPF